MILFSIACLCLAGCGSSPTKKGEQIGQAYCDCQKEYVVAQETAYADFLAKFDTYGLKTGTDASQKWQDVKDETQKGYEKCLKGVEENENRVKAEFPTDITDLIGDPLQGMSDPVKYAKELAEKQKEFAKNQEKMQAFRDALGKAKNACDAKEPQIDEAKILEKIQNGNY